MLYIKKLSGILYAAALSFCLAPWMLEGYDTPKLRKELREAIAAYKKGASEDAARRLLAAYREFADTPSTKKTADKWLSEVGTSYGMVEGRLLGLVRGTGAAAGISEAEMKRRIESAVYNAENAAVIMVGKYLGELHRKDLQDKLRDLDEQHHKEVERLKKESDDALKKASQPGTSNADMKKQLDEAVGKVAQYMAYKARIDKATGQLIRLAALIEKVQKGELNKGQNEENRRNFILQIKDMIAQVNDHIKDENKQLPDPKKITEIEEAAKKLLVRNVAQEVDDLVAKIKKVSDALPALFRVQIDLVKAGEQWKAKTFLDSLANLNALGTSVVDELDADAELKKEFEKKTANVNLRQQVEAEMSEGVYALMGLLQELAGKKAAYMALLEEIQAQSDIPMALASPKITEKAVVSTEVIDNLIKYALALRGSGIRLVGAKVALDRLKKDPTSKTLKKAFNAALDTVTSNYHKNLSDKDKALFNAAIDALKAEADKLAKPAPSPEPAPSGPIPEAPPVEPPPTGPEPKKEPKKGNGGGAKNPVQALKLATKIMDKTASEDEIVQAAQELNTQAIQALIEPMSGPEREAMKKQYFAQLILDMRDDAKQKAALKAVNEAFAE